MTKKLVYILSNTSSRKLRKPVQATAVREHNEYILVSLITNGEVSYNTLIEYIAERSNIVFVDVEKKRDLGVGLQEDFAGNLYKRVLEVKNDQNSSRSVQNLKIYPIKMNDITVEAVLRTCFNEYTDISGLTAAVIGIGNLGFKLSLGLTESGVHVKCYNRSKEKTFTATTAITYFKPKATISSPEACIEFLHSFLKTDFSIIACSQLSMPIEEIINLVKPSHKMFVLGHSVFDKDAFNKLKDYGIQVIRIDISQSLMSYVYGILTTENYDIYGERSFEGVTICSGGYVGEENTYIVDNYKDPKICLGLCDGKCGIQGGSPSENRASILKNIDDFDPLLD